MRSACCPVTNVMCIHVALASKCAFCVSADCMGVTVMGVERAFININTLLISKYLKQFQFIRSLQGYSPSAFIDSSLVPFSWVADARILGGS